MAISKTSDHIQIKIKMPTLSQEPPASSKAPNEDLKDMDVLYTFKIKMEVQSLAPYIEIEVAKNIHVLLSMIGSLEDAEGSSLGFDILIFIWIWSGTLLGSSLMF